MKLIAIVNIPDDDYKLSNNWIIDTDGDIRYLDEDGEAWLRYKSPKDDYKLMSLPQKIDIDLLNNMCKHCESMFNKRGELCPYRSSSNDYCKSYKILKDAIERDQI